MDKDLKQEIGIAVHTAFRKAAYSQDASYIHQAIRMLDRDEWDSVLEYVGDSLTSVYDITLRKD